MCNMSNLKKIQDILNLIQEHPDVFQEHSELVTIISFIISIFFIYYIVLAFIFVILFWEFWGKTFQREIMVVCVSFLYMVYGFCYIFVSIVFEVPTSSEVPMPTLPGYSILVYSAYVWVYIALCTIICLGFNLIKRKKFFGDDSLSYQDFIKPYHENPDYFKVKLFWKETFFKRKPKKKYILPLEVFVLLYASFGTFLRTRGINLLLVYLVFSSFLIFFNIFYPLAIFILNVGFLTLFFKLQLVQDYFSEMYTPTALKEIGCI